jgi:hypothetical protein
MRCFRRYHDEERAAIGGILRLVPVERAGPVEGGTALR